VALMTGTPTLSWFRDYPGRVEWQPAGPGHRSVLGRPTPDGLADITVAQLLSALTAVLTAPAPARVPPFRP
jgi:predicted NodU family carbamoyl transferase